MTEENKSMDSEGQVDLMTGVLRPLLQAMEALIFVSRHLHPPRLGDLAGQLQPFVEPLETGLAAFSEAAWPDHLQVFTDRMAACARLVIEAINGFIQAADQPEGIRGAYRSLRKLSRAQETIYPLSAMLPPVSQFFLEPDRRTDRNLLGKLSAAVPGEQQVSLVHVSNEKSERGGFSVYIPEYYDPEESYPVIMALHGGSGHGRDFVWSWLREARGRGAILISPTAMEGTWSLMEPERDSRNIAAILEYVGEHWSIDRGHMLLTGMSDGGTFAYVSGLRADSPFTHLAPFSASFHPMLLEFSDPEKIKGLPIYLVHGVLDWMFSVEIARTARQALTAAGAQVLYREIEDLSHTYARDENPAIMNWFLD